MKIFNVINKENGSVVYSYSSDLPIEWSGMEFNNFDHVEKQEPNVVNQELPINSVKITKLAFRNRFTPSEKAMLEFAAVDDPTVSIQNRQSKAMLRAYLNDVNAATYIDLNRKDTRDGVFALEAQQLIGIGRAIEILDTPVTEQEIFNAN